MTNNQPWDVTRAEAGGLSVSTEICTVDLATNLREVLQFPEACLQRLGGSVSKIPLTPLVGYDVYGQVSIS